MLFEEVEARDANAVDAFPLARPRKFGAYKKALGLTEGPYSPNYKRREELTVDRPYSHHATTSL